MGMALFAPELIADKESKGSNCSVSNTETAGPFPTITPASLVRSNIVGDRTGVPFTINIVIRNVNANCNPMQGVLVDIWHCDKDGNYSEYGGTAMQPTNYTNNDFLRGRQTTDAAGAVSFSSIFPGWYQGRATHIHVHIYTSTGTSLLITQIAFPEGAGSAVSTVNAATSYGYTKGMSGYTYNASDNVFSDGTSNEMGTVNGSLANGYTLDFEAYVSGPVETGINNQAIDTGLHVRQNFPNPCFSNTRIALVLAEAADVRVTVSDLWGQTLIQNHIGTLGAGEQFVDLDVSDLARGRYVYTVKINTTHGSFRQARVLIKG